MKVTVSDVHAAIIDEEDSDLAQVKWHAVTDRTGHIYARCSSKVGLFFMHRIIMERILNRALGKFERVRHNDGNGLNNARENLSLSPVLISPTPIKEEIL